MRTHGRRGARAEDKLNGEPIIIASDGTLLDGQHRLWAIVVSEATVPAVVVQGIDRSTFDTIDQGRKRTTGDVLSINGEGDSTLLAAEITWVWRYRRHLMLSSEGPTTQQAEELLDSHPHLRASLARPGKPVTWRRATGGVVLDGGRVR